MSEPQSFSAGPADGTAPSSNVNGTNSIQSAKDTVVSSKFSTALLFVIPANAQAAGSAIANHPVTQNVKDTVGNGPVAESVKNQYGATTNEFQNLANSRTKPDAHTATGQQLTQYHSLFYNLLSWENPRATAIAFFVNVLFIFAARYLNILHYLFKFLYLTLGVTAAAEVAGKLVFNNGFTSQVRPRRYYTIPRDTLETVLEDVQELINFFVIEFQRVLFAENVIHTIGAFAASLISYLLIKVVPLWGLALISTSIIYLAPLVYVNNRELIDSQIAHTSEIINSQAAQVKDIASHHAGRGVESVKSYAGDYTAKAQQYVGQARGRTGGALGTSTPAGTTSGYETGPKYGSSDFPTAPKTGPELNTTEEKVPTVAS